MKAIIDDIVVTGTPEEIHELLEMRGTKVGASASNFTLDVGNKTLDVGNITTAKSNLTDYTTVNN